LKSLDIMKVLGNKDSFDLFNIIAEKVIIDTMVLQSTTRLSKKRYYTGIQKLMACGLIRRKSKNLSLTSFGQIVNDIMLKMDSAVNEYYRLKAVDLIISSRGIGEKECRQLVDEFIKDREIKTVLLERIEGHLN
jgi:hypothetical protein